ncbi:MAG: hypothetical protein ACOC8N_02250 [Spirochaetota bacterium]
MRVLVLHDAVPGATPDPVPLQAASLRATPDQADNLEQARAVFAALEELGCRPCLMGFDGDARGLKAILHGNGFAGSARGRTACRAAESAAARGTRRSGRGWDLVFNLVETPAGGGRRIGLAPLVLESLGMPYTGCSSRALYLTSHKPAAKALLQRVGLPTPPWVAPRAAPLVIPRAASRGNGVDPRGTGAASARGPAGQGRPGPDIAAQEWQGAGLVKQEWPGPGRYILKSVWEHASIGLDRSAVVRASRAGDLAGALADRNSRGEGLFFAERYVAGREFNLSLLSGPGGVEVLPPAEMLFLEPAAAGLPGSSRRSSGDAGDRGAPSRILCYRSKWERGSVEYALSRRSFDFEPRDTPLLDRLLELALQCWELFGLNGYARVDFRVGPGGPLILEVNANPCIAPDSGFTAAAARAGLSYLELVERIAAHPAPVRLPAGRLVRGLRGGRGARG